MTSLPFLKQCLVKVMFSETIRKGDFKRINYSIYSFVAALFRMVATLSQPVDVALKRLESSLPIVSIVQQLREKSEQFFFNFSYQRSTSNVHPQTPACLLSPVTNYV